MDPSVDYYEVLGVGPDARLGELRSAYLRRIRSVHPDLSGADPATAHVETVRLNEAWDVLRSRRSAYDESRATWLKDHASHPLLDPGRVDFGRLVAGGRPVRRVVDVLVEGPRPSELRLLEDAGSFWALVGYSTPEEEDSPVVLSLDLEAVVPSATELGERVETADVLAFGVNVASLELRAEIAAPPPPPPPPPPRRVRTPAPGDRRRPTARTRAGRPGRSKWGMVSTAFMLVLVADGLLFLVHRTHGPAASGPALSPAARTEGFAGRPAPAVVVTPPSPSPGGFLGGASFVDDSAALSPGSCGVNGGNPPATFGPGFVGSVEPASDIELPSGSTQYFYVGDVASDDAMTSVSWPSDLSVLGGSSGSTLISIGRSLTGSGWFSAGPTTSESIAGIGVTGYVATPRASVSVPSGTHATLHLANPWNDVVLVVVGGAGTGALQVGGAPLQTLVDVTYRKCGSSLPSSAGVFAAKLTPGNYAISIDSSTYGPHREAALGAVAYTLVP